SAPKGRNTSAQGNALGPHPRQAPKGRNMLAQGNALGPRRPKLGQALKGRNRRGAALIAPRWGFGGDSSAGYQRRWPWLLHGAPSGLGAARPPSHGAPSGLAPGPDSGS